MNPDEIGLLHFEERYYERIWGGFRLGSVYGKPTPQYVSIGEAWLVSDHPGDESEVADGPFAGTTLHEILERDQVCILGRKATPTVHGRFPLLLKILDSQDRLSVQVHPDDECAKRLGEPDVGKTEMWHVLAADPGSELICGMDPSATPQSVAESVGDGSIERLMTSFRVKPGSSTFVPAGTVHAIGGGIVLAEIQQNSDLTYRLYDWGRVQDDGTPRQLHVDKALEAIDFGSSHGGEADVLSYELDKATCTVLAACRYFSAETIVFNDRFRRATRGDSFHIILCKSGSVTVTAGESRREVKPCQAILVPGAYDEYQAEGDGEFLDYYVPDLAKDVVEPLLDHGHARDRILRLGGDPAKSDLAGVSP